MTVTAPSIALPTDCPVDWCPETGHHPWSRVNRASDPERWHAVNMLVFTTDEGSVSTEVAVECYETVNGKTQVTVQLFEGHAQLLNRGEANELVDAIRQAADLAFGSELDHGADEFDAALKEVVERAANPADVNRLVAAAIRFRKAYQAVDAELDVEEKAEAGK